MDISTIREQYPQYSDLKDNELVDGLHSNFYSDMPKDKFYQSIGYSQVPDRPDFAQEDVQPTVKQQPKEESALSQVGNFLQLPSRMGQDLLNRAPTDIMSDMGIGGAQSAHINNAFFSGAVEPVSNIATNIYNKATNSTATSPVNDYRQWSQEQAKKIGEENTPSASFEGGSMLLDYANLAFGAGGAIKKPIEKTLFGTAKEYAKSAGEGAIIGSLFGAGKSIGMDNEVDISKVIESGAVLGMMNPLLKGIGKGYTKAVDTVDSIKPAWKPVEENFDTQAFLDSTKPLKASEELGLKPEEAKVAETISEQNNIPIEEAIKIVEDAKNTKSLDEQMELIRTHDRGGEEQAQTYKAQMQSWADRENANRVEQGLEPTVTADDMARQNSINYENKARPTEAELNTLFETVTDENGNFKTIGDRNKSNGWQDTQNTDAYGQEYTTRMAGKRGSDSEVTTPVSTLKKLKEEGYNALSDAERAMVDRDIDTIRNHPDFKTLEQTDGTHVNESGELVDADGNYLFQFVGAKDNEQGAFTDIQTKKVMREIDDSGASIKKPFPENGRDWKTIHESRLSQGKFTTLSDILEHPALFEKYPELNDVSISTKKGSGASFFMDGRYPRIEIGEDVLMVDVKETLLHEIQHAIQTKEKMPRGGNLKEFSELQKDFKEKLSYEEGNLKDWIDAKEWVDFRDGKITFKDTFASLDKTEEQYIKEMKYREKHEPYLQMDADYINKYLQEAKDRYNKVYNSPRPKSAFESYQSLYGEQQARATEYRKDMTPEQRAKESWQQTLERVEGKYEEPIIRYDDTLFQGEKYPQGVKGAYSIDSKLIQIFESHDVSTLNHELGHRFLHTLSEKEFSVASEIFGVKDGKWTREHHEAFADAYARYIAEGKTPVKGLKAIFDKFKKFTIEILKSLKENNGGKMPKLSPEMKEFFSATLGHEPSRAKLFERIKEKESKADMGDGTLYQTASQKEHLKEVYKDSHPLTKNEDGTPKVFYHGTKADFNSFNPEFIGSTDSGWYGKGYYFTTKLDDAHYYAGENGGKWVGDSTPIYDSLGNEMGRKYAESAQWVGNFEKGSNIMPVYLNMKNPKIINERIEQGSKPHYQNEAELIKQGHDGVIIKRYDEDGLYTDEIVVFDPTKIKSIHNKPLSEGKSPDFENSNILYQQYKKGQLPNAKSLPDETKLELVQRKLQDKFNRVTKLLESKADINKLDDAMNPYQAEELYHGRVEARIQDFEKSTVKPIIELISESKHTIEEVDAYLHARHAIERNKKMLDDNGVIDGSGMSDAEAIALINHYANNPKMNEIAQKVYAMNRERLKLIKQEGLETDEFITKIDGTYNHYVPLKRIMDNTQQGMRTGRGYDIKGKEVKRAKGSDRAVESPLMNSILSYQETLIRAEKNKVGQAMYEFTQAYPDSSLYTVKGVQHAPMYDKYGDVVGMNPQYKLDDNVLHVKIDGKVKEITFHDPLLATAFKNLNADQMSNAMILVQKATRFLASVNTQYNPEFVVGNFERDLQTALINLPKEVKGNRLIIAKDVGSAIKGIYGSVRERKTNKWGVLFEEMKREGGTTGWIEQYNVADMKSKTEAMIRRYDGQFMPKDAFLETLRYIDDVNTAVENGTRLVAYKLAKESGLSNKKSASIAKNLTVNFNRKGEASTGINAMYMFFNASVQGSTRMLQALKRSNTAKAIAGGIIGASIGLNYYNNSVNAEAYEKIPDYEKDTNYIFMKEDGTYYKVKIPYGYNLFKTMGDVVADGMQSNVKLEDMPKRLFNATLNAMSPMGGGNSDFVQSISPTIVRPAVDLALNKNFAGQNIMPEDSPYAPSTTPDAYKYFKSVNPIAKNVAQGLNKATGGNLHKSGAIDVSPETLEYLTEAITGGLGKLISRSITTGSKLMNDEKVDMNKVPFARILMGEPNEKFEQSKFYEMYKKSGLNEFDVKDKQKFLKYGQVAVQKGDIEPKAFVSMLKQFVSNQQKINWADTNDVQSYDQVKQNPEMLNGVPKGEIKKIVKGDKKAGQ